MNGAEQRCAEGRPTFGVLGPVEVVSDEGGVRRFTAYRQRTVLGLLLLRVNNFVAVEELIDAIWDESPPSTARGQVQICVSRLRRDLLELTGDKVIATWPGGYICQLADERVDISLFERYSRQAESCLREGRTAEALAELRSALALWRGPVLSGAAGRARRLADALDEKRVGIHEQCIELELALGNHRDIVGELTELVTEYPLREQLRAYLMVALYRSGRQAEALEVYRLARKELIEELGIEPSDSLRRIESSILAGDDALELADRASAPSKTTTFDVPHQLPADVGDFTGRGLAVAAVEDVLGGEPTANATRITRISGRGGVGKTALAVHVGHRLADRYPDGQLFACMHGSANTTPQALAADVQRRFLQAIGLRADDLPSDLDELQGLYRSRLTGRRMLIVLDDVDSEQQLAPLLPGSATCSMVVTSRRQLGNLPGALALDLDVLEHKHATQLLEHLVGEARAIAEPEELQSLVRLCGRWPLALRIIGARLAARPHWTLSLMVERLQDEQRRLDEIVYGDLHVRSTLAVSYAGLSSTARELFRSLGLCSTVEFSTWVPAALLDTDPRRAEDVLEELVETRLVDVIDPATRRYGFHDLVRIFAQERAVAEDDEQVRQATVRRFIGAHLALTREAHRRLYGGDFTVLHGTGYLWWLPEADIDRELADPMSWLEVESRGLVAAIHQAAASGFDELCWDLALTSVTLFEARGFLHHWQETHECALQAVRRVGNTRGEAALLCSLGSLRQVAKGEAGTGGLEEALRLFISLGDHHGQALTLRNLAFGDRMEGRYDSALERYVSAVNGFREVGDLVAEAHTLVNLAKVHMGLLQFEQAENILGEAMELCRRTGNRRVEAQTWQRFGELYLDQDRHQDAERSFQRVLSLVRPIDDQIGEVFALCGLGETRTRQDDFVEAEKMLVRALDICGVVSAHLGEGRVLLTLGWLHMARREFDTADEYLRQASDSFEELRATVWRARALDSLAEVRLHNNQPQAAEELGKQGLGLLQSVTSPEADRIYDRIRRHLPRGSVEEDGAVT